MKIQDSINIFFNIMTKNLPTIKSIIKKIQSTSHKYKNHYIEIVKMIWILSLLAIPENALMRFIIDKYPNPVDDILYNIYNCLNAKMRGEKKLYNNLIKKIKYLISTFFTDDSLIDYKNISCYDATLPSPQGSDYVALKNYIVSLIFLQMHFMDDIFDDINELNYTIIQASFVMSKTSLSKTDLLKLFEEIYKFPELPELIDKTIEILYKKNNFYYSLN